MEKFQQLKYERADLEQAKQDVLAFVEKFKQAKTYEEARALYIENDKQSAHLGTMYTLASIRNSIDTSDKFYEDEMNFYNEEIPAYEVVAKAVGEALLCSPFKAQFEEEFGSDLVKALEAQQVLADERIIPEKVEEAKLSQEYSKITAQAKTQFRGEECNFYGLLKHMQSVDRAERKEAFEAWAELYRSISGTLDQIYSRLCALRNQMAQKLGFESYTKMAYLANGHYYYNEADVAAFRQQVVDVVVPAATELFARQQKHIGVDKLHYYDEAFVYPEGNVTPKGNRDELVQKAQQMYTELSPETAEFFRFMVEHDMFDLETKPNKQMGGYCTFLDEFKSPFIFSNFNGTSADVDVLTHEAGHAFQAFTSAKYVTLSSQIWSTSEISEIHSMTMEHFAYPWMELFFGDRADDYRYAHLSEALKVVPYLCLVDHFQSEVFKKPDMTAEEYRATWRRLEKIYMPWRDYDGNAFLEEGGFWMQKQHIFLYPFYYVDYALAAMGAFEYYARSLEDPTAAWNDYLGLCKLGGSKPYFTTLQLANLSNPFQQGTVQKVCEKIIQKLYAAKY